MSKKFNKESTALEVVEGISLNGLLAMVTGGASGIGIETARALAKAGATVIITSRDPERSKNVVEDIIKTTGNSKIESEKLELDSLASVDAFVAKFMAQKRPLNILINNAGTMGEKLVRTKEGFENQFGVNHMGHFALTLGLLPALKEGAKVSGRNSRVVNLASVAHCFVKGKILFDDINFLKTEYDELTAYGQSKLSNILFSVELNKRFAKDGINSNAVMPGVILTNLQKRDQTDIAVDANAEWVRKDYLAPGMQQEFSMKSHQQGASTSAWAATSPDLEGKGGFYLENCEFSKPNTNPHEIFKIIYGYLPIALDSDQAEKLWIVSEQYLKNRKP